MNWLSASRHLGQTYNLQGTPITQAKLATYMNRAFDTDLKFRTMRVEDYRADRVAELGPFIGTVIAGIYEGIRNGAFERSSDFEAVTGRPHQSWDEYFAILKGGHYRHLQLTSPFIIQGNPT